MNQKPIAGQDVLVLLELLDRGPEDATSLRIRALLEQAPRKDGDRLIALQREDAAWLLERVEHFYEHGERDAEKVRPSLHRLRAILHFMMK